MISVLFLLLMLLFVPIAFLGLFLYSVITRKKGWLIASAATSFTGTILFLYAFYERFFRWRHLFNEENRAYDVDGSSQVLTTGGMFWIVPAIAFFLFGAAAIFLLLSERRSSVKTPKTDAPSEPPFQH